MTELTPNLSLAQARSLIDSYAFDLGRNDAEQLLEYWLKLYQASWIRLATIEALYLGRYKAISIEQILNVWLRIGSPNPHFTYEFERLICRKLPKHLNVLPDSEVESVETPTAIGVADSPFPSEMSANSSSRSIPEVEPEPVQHRVAVTEPEAMDLAKAVENGDRSIDDNVSLISALGLSYKDNWSELTEGSKMIHEFIPLPDVSSFFDKLKTFGERRLESQ